MQGQKQGIIMSADCFHLHVRTWIPVKPGYACHHLKEVAPSIRLHVAERQCTLPFCNAWLHQIAVSGCGRTMCKNSFSLGQASLFGQACLVLAVDSMK